MRGACTAVCHHIMLATCSDPPMLKAVHAHAEASYDPRASTASYEPQAGSGEGFRSSGTTSGNRGSSASATRGSSVSDPRSSGPGAGAGAGTSAAAGTWAPGSVPQAASSRSAGRGAEYSDNPLLRPRGQVHYDQDVPMGAGPGEGDAAPSRNPLFDSSPSRAVSHAGWLHACMLHCRKC